MNRLLFVYGTLRPRSSHPMAEFLARHSRVIGPARVAGQLYNLGRFPGLLPADAPDEWVIGDVVEVDDDETFAALDRYEDAEGIFPRRQAFAHYTDGREETVWAYYYAGNMDNARRIPSGEYQHEGADSFRSHPGDRS